ncbi:hypothetical protein A1O1_05420 [Capronia coronata CBS 617.96]|uniref:VOC domain-containing protein n=1 Tax=Capronia coronata CBS 617.96 TaxID=1182541 RepID=W9YFP8_9EURO|nr:uncharacterized protein A1O1_05420 [Capronia coronata CBS 617.96]EXJ88490.1 hypothetical protein A1O1_05420 [Capronia coronata CBS 617.96]
MPSSITLTVSHLPTSTSFFLSCLQPLDYVFRGRQDQTIGFGPASPATTPPDFWITQEIPGVPAGAAHVAFPASSRAQVEAFFVAALKAGGKIHGEPSQRDASGYFSAAVIDFDGNSIEAVYRPVIEKGDGHETGSGSEVGKNSNKVIAGTVVSQAKSKASAAPSAARSVVTGVSGAKPQAPSSIGAKSVVTVAKAPSTVVSQAKTRPASTVVSRAAPSRATTAPPPPPSALSQVRSVTAPSYVGSLAGQTQIQRPVQTQIPQQVEHQQQPAQAKSSSDMLNTLINDARTAASVARDLVNSVKPNLNANTNPALPAAADGQSNGASTTASGGAGAGEAIVGTLLGVAAGAALHYAFSSHSRSKEKLETTRQQQQLQLQDGYGIVGPPMVTRPSVVGRNITDPTPLPLRTEYAYGYEYGQQSTVGSGVYPGYYSETGGKGKGTVYYRAIEPGPAMSGYTAGRSGSHCSCNDGDGPHLIAMQDNDIENNSSVHHSSHSTHSVSTIRPSASHAKSSSTLSLNAGSQASASASASQVSRQSSGSKKSNVTVTRSGSVKMKFMNAPPTSYRAPTVLTAAETQLVAGSSAAKSSHSTSAGGGSRRSSSRSRSLSRVMGLRGGDGGSEAGDKASKASHRSHSQSRMNGSIHSHSHSHASSRRSRRDRFDDGDDNGNGNANDRNDENADDEVKTVVHRSSVASSSLSKKLHGHDGGSGTGKEAHEYPLPPSRAATWAGSDASRGKGIGVGVGIGSLVSAASGRLMPGKHISAPRTVIGKLNPLRNSGGGVGVGGDTISVVSKQKDLADLDVPDREVRPEDSVSQVSVESRRSKRSSSGR